MNVYEKIKLYLAQIKGLLKSQPPKKKGDVIPYIAIVMISNAAGEHLASAKMFAELGYSNASVHDPVKLINENQKCLFVANAEQAAFLKGVFREKILTVYVKVGVMKLRSELPERDQEVREEFSMLERPDFISEHIDLVIDSRYHDKEAILAKIREAAGYIKSFQIRKSLVKETLM